MVSVLLSRLVILTAGTLYPAYRSYKAVKTKNVREYVKWMMYWIVFAIFLCVETFADIFIAFWCPFYYELKMLFVIWLLSPYTKGASFLYRKFIHPTLNRHEEEIDLYLDGAKQRGYSALLQVGSKGINYAKEVVATAAIKGQVQLVNQLKKSCSMNDVTDSANEDTRMIVSEYSTEGRVWEGYYDEDGEPVVEREFQYLYDNDVEHLERRGIHQAQGRMRRDDGATEIKSRATKRSGSRDILNAYGTMPRRGNRSVANAAARRPPLPMASN